MSNKNVNNVEVNEKLVSQVTGAGISGGFFCTISGECRADGRSCWDILDEILNP